MKQREFKFRRWNGVEMYYPHTNGMDDYELADLNHPKIGPWMQFTGLLDNNGKEIYEGDIVTHEDAYGACVIEYQTAEYVACDRRGMGYDLCAKCEIIGNIHENPELLK